MSKRVSRRMEYADRLTLQQADQAIRKDVNRALVELITNSNDSYHRMEDSGQAHSGVIVIEIQRRISNSVLRVRDFAEGMNSDEMDRKVGRYAEATSGFKEGNSVRGLWGRGLKDSIYGLGEGHIQSFYENTFNSCSLFIKDTAPMYVREVPIRVSRAMRKQFEMPSGNGTTIEITISRDGVRTPLFANLRRMLEQHFELRTIMSNPKRRVVLRDLDGRGKVKQEVELSYKAPTGKQVLDEVLEIPGTATKAHLEVFRSDEPLSTPAEAAEYALGGLLVMSKRIVLALTLLKFENNEHAVRFYGNINCDYFHELLNRDEPVLTATRDGINWKHPFAKSLKEAIEKKLEPLVEEERRRTQAEERTTVNKRLREKLDIALKELNSIASLELGKVGGSKDGNGDGTDRTSLLPPSGFDFVHEYAYVQTGKPAGLTLRASIPDKVASGSLVTIESDNPEVTILTPQVVIEEKDGYPNVGQARVEVEGRQVGAEAVITARVAGRLDVLKAEAWVKVISKKEPQDSPRVPRTGGLFKGYRFDPTAEPRQRVRFDRATAYIVIATKAPSVAVYLDETGRGIEQPQGQVILAELITEAVCREIARQGVEKGTYLAPFGGEADAIQRKYIDLQNQYAHRIHACIVDVNYRRGDVIPQRKGRISREEQLAKVVTAAVV